MINIADYKVSQVQKHLPREALGQEAILAEKLFRGYLIFDQQYRGKLVESTIKKFSAIFSADERLKTTTYWYLDNYYPEHLNDYTFINNDVKNYLFTETDQIECDVNFITNQNFHKEELRYEDGGFNIYYDPVRHSPIILMSKYIQIKIIQEFLPEYQSDLVNENKHESIPTRFAGALDTLLQATDKQFDPRVSVVVNMMWSSGNLRPWLDLIIDMNYETLKIMEKALAKGYDLYSIKAIFKNLLQLKNTPKNT